MVQVETYEVPEVAYDGTVESSEEAITLIRSLGLQGQEKLISGNKNDVRSPYRKMTKEEFIVYSSLFEDKTPIDKYGDEPIPLRVLQVAAHAKDLFDKLEVWHKPNADIKDPILVGCNGESWSSTREYFMLARWGDSLMPFAELATVAAKIMREKLSDALNEGIQKLQSRLDGLPKLSDGAFIRGEESAKVPTIY
jgi:hypothetical protein